jgi:hypothetical protein
VSGRAFPSSLGADHEPHGVFPLAGEDAGGGQPPHSHTAQAVAGTFSLRPLPLLW